MTCLLATRPACTTNFEDTLDNTDKYVRDLRSYLKGLYVNDNQLIGTIPSELGQLTDVERLSLNNNQLSGAIPSELGQLSNLVRLYLNENQLSGALPSELGQLNK